MAARIRKEYGQHIVSDLKICHGHLTFKGTRILVKDVLFYVGQGKDWDWIVEAYDSSINREGIAEAINLASQTLIEKIEKPRRAQVERVLGPFSVKAKKKRVG
jgi:uncharacterized protein (DUF433 family)